MRLDRFLANSGIGSRKDVKIFIKKGRIKVNGVIEKSSSISIDENKDKVSFDDEIIQYKEFYYFLLNKPEGYVSAVTDNVYPPVTDLIIGYDFVDLSPVGRLDVDTTGTLLLTNDGMLCHRLISPTYHVDKTYSVETDKTIPQKLISAFEKGIELDGEMTLPAKLVILEEKKAELTIHQGKFHQVKRMFKYFGIEVVKLDRKTFAFLHHEDIEKGNFRELSEEEVIRLKELVESK